jgi:hypothetical protein
MRRGVLPVFLGHGGVDGDHGERAGSVERVQLERNTWTTGAHACTHTCLHSSMSSRVPRWGLLLPAAAAAAAAATAPPTQVSKHVPFGSADSPLLPAAPATRPSAAGGIVLVVGRHALHGSRYLQMCVGSVRREAHSTAVQPSPARSVSRQYLECLEIHACSETETEKEKEKEETVFYPVTPSIHLSPLDRRQQPSSAWLPVTHSRKMSGTWIPRALPLSASP